jgi:translation initiation factor 2 subunit 1
MNSIQIAAASPHCQNPTTQNNYRFEKESQTQHPIHSIDAIPPRQPPNIPSTPRHQHPNTLTHPHPHPPTMSLTNCRFYEEKFPEIDSFVMVNVKQIAEMGAYVKLLEYDNIDGMILLSELSRRRIRSIQKLIRVGRNEVVVVLRVDKEKGYIDLSKRRVSPEDIVKCEERYNKSKMVHSIMRHVAEKTNVPLEELYKDIGWPLNKKYGHAVDAFKLSITNPAVWDEVTFQNAVIKDELISYISKRLTPQPTKVRADVEVTCFAYEGIDAIRAALVKAEEKSSEAAQVKVRLVSPPLYVFTSQTLDKQIGIDVLNEAIKDVDAHIRAAGGSCSVKMAPKAVTENDDAELQALMDKRERENQEVSGDEDESESDDGVVAAD